MIAIIDYGAGNIFSVKNALDYLGLPGELTADPEKIRKADALILPGVGAFPSAMQMLHDSGLTDVIREESHKKPFLGICLGMQCAVIEFARNVLGIADANSSEMESTPHPVIDLMEEQKGVTEKGGTMRLGGYPCTLEKGSKAYAAYGRKDIVERHRHRYEFNNDYLDEFVRAGLKPVGVNPDTNLVEVVEMQDHPWFIGVQYHPEYKSTALHPHPLFVSFVKASTQYCKDNNGCK